MSCLSCIITYDVSYHNAEYFFTVDALKSHEIEKHPGQLKHKVKIDMVKPTSYDHKVREIMGGRAGITSILGY